MLLLGSHRGGLGGNEPFDHLLYEGKGDESDDDPSHGVGVIEEGNAENTEEDVVDEKARKQSAPIEQSDVVEFGDN